MEGRNEIPFCNIRIDKDGVWYYRGAKMFRREIVNLLYQHLRRDSSGQYIIEMEEDCCWIEVEDTPFVIKAVNPCDGGNENPDLLYLLLSDGSTETLDTATLRIGKDNIPYCMVKNHRFEARFSRASYYQIADYIGYDTEKDEYYLSLNGKTHRICCIP